MPTLTMVGITNFRFSLKVDLTVPHAVCFVPEADVADIFMLFNGFTLAGLSPLNLMHRADQKRTYVVGDNHVAIRQLTDADDPASPLQQRR